MRFRRTARIVKLILVAVLVVLSRKSKAAEPKATGPFDLDGQTQVLGPIVYKQVAIMPLVRKAGTPVDTRKYLTLEEGLRTKKVRVSEKGRGGTVNQVEVHNGSSRPLFLLGGQVILGGQQDRILGKDTVLAPGEVASLEVYCVEHGRWSGSREFSQTGGMASTKMRAKAKFAADQSAVWAAVAEKQANLGGSNATGTYRTLATGDAGRKAAAPYREHILAALDHHPESRQMVGFVAAVNGRVVSVEVFANHGLFADHRDNLLDGIFLSAADQPVAVPEPDQAPSPEKVRDFVRRADTVQGVDAMLTRAAKTTQKKAAGVVNSEVQDASSPPRAAPVYRSYQSEE